MSLMVFMSSLSRSAILCTITHCWHRWRRVLLRHNYHPPDVSYTKSLWFLWGQERKPILPPKSRVRITFMQDDLIPDAEKPYQDMIDLESCSALSSCSSKLAILMWSKNIVWASRKVTLCMRGSLSFSLIFWQRSTYLNKHLRWYQISRAEGQSFA